MARHDYYEAFEVIKDVYQPDGLGGGAYERKVVQIIKAGVYVNTSNEAVIAGRVGNKAIFVIQTDADVCLKQHDIVRRKRDGAMFRVAGNAKDKTTPNVATEQYREVVAEVIV